MVDGYTHFLGNSGWWEVMAPVSSSIALELQYQTFTLTDDEHIRCQPIRTDFSTPFQAASKITAHKVSRFCFEFNTFDYA